MLFSRLHLFGIATVAVVAATATAVFAFHKPLNRQASDFIAHQTESLNSLSAPEYLQSCPTCKTAANVSRVVYGLPSSELQNQAIREELYLGGCGRPPEGPDYYCKNCKKTWAFAPAMVPGTKYEVLYAARDIAKGHSLMAADIETDTDVSSCYGPGPMSDCRKQADALGKRALRAIGAGSRLCCSDLE